MYRYQHISTRIKKYRAEIVISAISTVVGAILGKAADIYLLAPTADRVMLAILVMVILVIVGQMFIIKRNIILKIEILQDRVDQVSGRFTLSQYDERKRHFAEEKQRIIENLVQTILPREIEKLMRRKASEKSPSIAMIVDSGTTLEQFFPRAKLMGFGPTISDPDLRRIQIYTNSLSGSDAFCKMPASYLREDQLHLFGGIQIEKYRAVLGDVTLAAMGTVSDEYKNNGGKIIGLTTANWVLVGAAYDKLVFCSTEKGHLEFKQLLAEISDTLIITAPLGKLLKLNTIEDLNAILKLKEEGKPEYGSFDIRYMKKRNKTNTILLTTYRTKADSILHSHSLQLTQVHNDNAHDLYTLCEKTRPFILNFNASYDEQVEIEMPHHYLRDHAFRVLNVRKR